MNRKVKTLLNMFTGLLKQFVVLVCSFILPRYMLLYYGSEVTGLVSSVTHFLGFITLLEMGVGPVIQANLYKPLAEKNKEQISKILKSSDRFFRRIAYIFLIYLIVLAFVLPKIIDSDFDSFFTISLLFIISISTFAEYFFGMTYKLLLIADQKAYIQLILQMGVTILNTVASVILIIKGFSIQVVKLSTAFIFVLRPLVQLLYVRKHYNIDKKIVLQEEPVKQKWDGFAQHLAMVVLENAAVVILTLFSTLVNVAIYNVYYAVTSGVKNLIMSSVTGLESLFGDMIARDEKEKLLNTFEIVEFSIHFVVVLIFTCATILIVPFVTVYTRGITDANYNQPLFGFIITMAYCAQCLRVPYLRLVKGAGMFKETRNGALYAMVINIGFTLIGVFTMGLSGVAIGTFIGMIYHTVYFALFLRRNIINRSFNHFLCKIFIDSLIVTFSVLLTKSFMLSSISYFSWFILAVKVFFVVLLIDTFVNTIFNFQLIKKLLKQIIRR